MKKTLIAAIAVIIVGVGVYYFTNKSSDKVPVITNQNTTTTSTVATTTPIIKNTASIGTSVQGRDINAYHFGTGTKEILFVGGIHGGYEWNTSLLAYNLMDYFTANPNIIPTDVKVTIIPVLNPDGLNKVVGTSSRFNEANLPTSEVATTPGRFNGNNVDLNRNFACDWQAKGVWQDKTVSGGASAFSEPESLAIKNYIETNTPKAVVVWYSAAGGVYSSNCHDGILAETTKLTNTYAKASGYPANDTFDFYATTGDMVNWLAKIKIPAISVLLTNHKDTEWTKNLAGVKAVLNYYSK